ncbi:peptidoglycan-binding protein [Kitasatospora aureofaciens]|uniref:peptidoglycan-binding domain-containing protein n=1 Tax=Kitasatospora aureofaciens TaxID=1894 RepID=UPI001C440B4D|nr:peptidoglycan-binding domain-containing protein [Kitasatospora aureofaciens]MBV6703067.1 peptidoglycan-binding protein [Kitasatospora aureofaciens]
MRKTWALRAATLTLGATAALGLAVGSAGAATAPSILQLGDTGPSVKCVQQGLNLANSANLVVNGTFDQATYKAVVAFQQGLTTVSTTGKVDPLTGNAIFGIIDMQAISTQGLDLIQWEQNCMYQIPHTY